MDPSGNDQIRFEWYPSADETAQDLRQDAEKLRASAASVQLLEPKGVIPVVGWIIAVMALTALVREVADVVCRVRKKGMIIDARGTGCLKIRKTADLPGGVVVVIAKDGTSSEYNVCDGTTNLAALIKAVS